MTSKTKKWLGGSAIGVAVLVIWKVIKGADRGDSPPRIPPEGGEASQDVPRQTSAIRAPFNPPAIAASADPFRTPILFGHDSVRVHRNYHNILLRLGNLLRESRSSVLLTGYASRSGSDDYNSRLSMRRAQAIVEFIQGLNIGVRPTQFVVRAAGESNPKATPAQSRRVEITPR